MPTFAPMFMKAKHRKTRGGEEYIYYTLCGSWRDSQGITARDELLHVGRRDDFDVWEMREVADIVTDRANGEPQSAFYEQEHSQKVRMMADSVYSQLIALGKIDIPGRNRPGESDLERCRREHERRFIGDVSTAKHPWSLQIGAEHLCYETMRKLRLGEVLGSLGFNNDEVSLALTQIAVRAIHPASEYATAQWIKPHSDICRLTGYDVDKITKDRLYQSAIHLYDVREGLMKHLSRWTKELFGYDDNLILYDLTNVYAEGDYDDSKWWDYGRSKEKRDDCKLLVLALVVNRHGFPKHYQLFEGRMQDFDSFVKIIDELDAHMKSLGVSPIVVMDAGIATAISSFACRAPAARPTSRLKGSLCSTWRTSSISRWRYSAWRWSSSRERTASCPQPPRTPSTGCAPKQRPPRRTACTTSSPAASRPSWRR